MTADTTTASLNDQEVLAEHLQRLADRTARGRRIHGIVLAVGSDDGSTNVRVSAGAAQVDSPYLIASVSKLYTAAIVGQLVGERRLRYDGRVVDLLPGLDLLGLHRFEGVDRTEQLHVHHLLRQTSGLGDYFEGSGGVQEDLNAGRDRAYDIGDVVTMARAVGADFPPGDRDGRRAAYSDTNFQLLSAIVEAVDGEPFARVLERRITGPLGLTATHLFVGDDTSGILPVHHRDRRLSFPLALASEQGAGGIVSTLDEQLRFSRAFHAGDLFDLPEPRFNRIHFPLQYGPGVMRYRPSRWMAGGRSMPELVGHSGSTGSWLFHSRELGVHIAGTVNQADSPARPFRLLPQVTRIVERAMGAR